MNRISYSIIAAAALLAVWHQSDALSQQPQQSVHVRTDRLADQPLKPLWLLPSPSMLPVVPQYKPPTIPPAEYDRMYNGELKIVVVNSAEEFVARCHGIKVSAVGCSYAYGGTGRCDVYIRDDATIRSKGWSTALVLRHEMAHCMGWPKDHPGTRAYKE